MDFSKILFLSCLNDKKLYGYLPYADRVESPIEQVKEFNKKGYVDFSTPEDNLTRFTVPELKRLLSDHGISVKGTKPVLIKSILENIPSSEYTDLAEPKTKVFLTDKANTILKDYEYLLWFKNNENTFYRVTEDEVRELAMTTPASEMITAIQKLNRKKRLNEMMYTAQTYRDMYDEIRYNKCIVCDGTCAGSYDLCENCENASLTDTQVFHICQLFGCRNKAAISNFDLDMSQSYREGIPEEAVQAFKDFCYSFGTPGILYYSERKKRADRSNDPTPGSPYYLIKTYG